MREGEGFENAAALLPQDIRQAALSLPAEARASAEEVAGDRFDSEKMQFHHDVRNAFLDLAAKEPERFAVIDAGKTPEEVHRQIMEAVHARLEAL